MTHYMLKSVPRDGRTRPGRQVAWVGNGHVPSTHAIVINSGHSIIYLGGAFLLFSKISRSGHFISSLEQAAQCCAEENFASCKGFPAFHV